MNSEAAQALLRFKTTDGVSAFRLSDALVDEKQMLSLMISDQNVAYLTKRIIDRADPLRNNAKASNSELIATDVRSKISAWHDLGKFKYRALSYEGKHYIGRTTSPIAQLDLYNDEFVDTFAEKILPSPDVTSVTSVTNPDGLYAQQSRSIKVMSKPISIHQRSVFKRLNAFDMDVQVDETEAPFYRLDHNPNLTMDERQKRDVDTSQQTSYLDREGLSYRMKPRYQ